MSEENAVMEMLVPDTGSEDVTEESIANDANDPGSDDLKLDDAISKESSEAAAVVDAEAEADSDKDLQPVETKPESEPEKTEPAQQQVPLHELLRERNNRQTKERELTDLRGSVAALEAKLEALQNPPSEVPDAEEDPAGFLQHKTKELETEIDSLKTKNTEAETKTKQDQKRENIQNHINTKQAEFEGSTPDFKESISHMRQAQYNHLVGQGFTEKQAIDGIFQNEFNEATQMMAMGYNPAEMMYQKSVSRFGYVKPVPKADPAPVADDNKATKEKFANTDKALAAAKGSGKSGGNLSVEQMLNSPDEEFNKMWSEANGGAKNPYS